MNKPGIRKNTFCESIRKKCNFGLLYTAVTRSTSRVWNCDQSWRKGSSCVLHLQRQLFMKNSPALSLCLFRVRFLHLLLVAIAWDSGSPFFRKHSLNVWATRLKIRLCGTFRQTTNLLIGDSPWFGNFFTIKSFYLAGMEWNFLCVVPHQLRLPLRYAEIPAPSCNFPHLQICQKHFQLFLFSQLHQTLGNYIPNYTSIRGPNTARFCKWSSPDAKEKLLSTRCGPHPHMRRP